MQEIVIMTLLTTITLVQCLKKWGFFNWYDSRLGHYKTLPDARCMLCFGFWLSILIAALYLIAAHYGLRIIFVPFASAGLVNFFSTFLNVLSSDRDSNK
jgi:hypothetical protein